jgi:hypothetical protein
MNTKACNHFNNVSSGLPNLVDGVILNQEKHHSHGKTYEAANQGAFRPSTLQADPSPGRAIF